MWYQLSVLSHKTYLYVYFYAQNTSLKGKNFAKRKKNYHDKVHKLQRQNQRLMKLSVVWHEWQPACKQVLHEHFPIVNFFVNKTTWSHIINTHTDTGRFISQFSCKPLDSKSPVSLSWIPCYSLCWNSSHAQGTSVFYTLLNSLKLTNIEKVFEAEALYVEQPTRTTR